MAHVTRVVSQSAIDSVATVFLRQRPLVVAPMLAIFLTTLALVGSPRAQLAAMTVVGSTALCFFAWEAWRGKRLPISSRHLSLSLLVTLVGLTIGSAATGGARSPLLFMTFAPTVVGFAAFGRSRASDALFVAGLFAFVLVALLPPGVPFPPLPDGAARGLVVVCGACALLLLRLGVAALTDAHAAAREVAAGAGEDVVAAAAARTAAVEAMGAKVAHEVRNPLSAIRGLVEVIAEKVADERDKKRLDVVRGEVDRIDEILRGYLDLARPLERLEPRDCDAGRLAEEVAAILEGRVERAGLTLIVEAQPRSLHADPRRLKEALLNLLLNAIAVTKPGGRIVIRATPSDGDVLFEVEDEGPGMTRGELANAGKPFMTRREGGTGLGLALVRNTAEQHGGKLELESARGRGTIARLRLPAPSPPKETT